MSEFEETDYPDARQFFRAYLRSAKKGAIYSVVTFAFAIFFAAIMEPLRAIELLGRMTWDGFILMLLWFLFALSCFGWAAAIRKLKLDHIGEISVLGAILNTVLFFSSLVLVDAVWDPIFLIGLLNWQTSITLTIMAWWSIRGTHFMLGLLDERWW